jgi:branched-chain amino acid transport system substrate-binding protein
MNFDATLARIRLLAPDAVYLLHSGGMAVNFIRQYGASPLKASVPLFGPAMVFDQTVLAGAGEASLGLMSLGPWSDDMDSPANKRMMADFEADYGRPPSLFAAEGYDAAMLIDSALRAIDRKHIDEEALRTALRRADFASTRISFHFDTNQMPIQSYVLREVVQDARGHFASEAHPTSIRDLRDGHANDCPMRWVVEPLPPPKG